MCRTGLRPPKRAGCALTPAPLEASSTPERSGCRWNDLPDLYGVASTTAWRCLRRWEEDGAWKRLWRALSRPLDRQERLRWAEAFLDGSFVPAKRGGEPSERVRKGKGAKLMRALDVRVGKRTRPGILVCDRGYDSRSFRRYLLGARHPKLHPGAQKAEKLEAQARATAGADPARYAQPRKMERASPGCPAAALSFAGGVIQAFTGGSC